DESLGPICIVTLPATGDAIQAGVSPSRQEKPHAHSLVFDPTGRFALSADLGMDRVWVYRFENNHLAANHPQNVGTTPAEPGLGNLSERMEYGWIGLGDNAGQMAETPAAYQHAMLGHNLKPGAGPRHIAFHPNGRFFYVSNELDSTVTVFAWGSAKGYLKPVQNLSTLPADFNGQSDVAHVALTPDGRFLYVSNRGHNSISIFSVDPDTGLLTAAGHTSTRGRWPRNFCIDPDGRFLIAANQESNDIFVFAIDPASGDLKPTGISVNIPNPLFVTVIDL
ncbi:MAG: lactonase family protein, partial [Anaerolineaceae bacterium]|nr:lactonase family protein [Anaerolineaceae bacterium]